MRAAQKNHKVLAAGVFWRRLYHYMCRYTYYREYILRARVRANSYVSEIDTHRRCWMPRAYTLVLVWICEFVAVLSHCPLTAESESAAYYFEAS